MTAILPYGAWRSPITSDLIVAESIGLMDVLVERGDIYWTETRPGEGGRYVLVRRSADGTIADATPAPYGVRSRVHEYGGGAVTVHQRTIYFTNFSDQRLYVQQTDAAPAALTPEPDPGAAERGLRYADGIIDERRSRWIGVREEHRANGAVVNALVAIDLATGGAGRVLAGGNDFYSSPRLSQDGGRLAWLTWHHPNMPWVGSELWLAEIGADGMPGAPLLVAGGDSESICQPEWSPDGRLHFVSDRSGWWNLYRCEDECGGAQRALCPKPAEFGQAQWTFAQSTYAFLGPGELVCRYGEGGSQRLARLDIASGRLVPFDLPYGEFAHVRAFAGGIACRAGAPDRTAAIVLIEPQSGAVQVLRRANQAAEEAALRRYFSMPRQLEFPTEGGSTAHAHYYAPVNPDCAAPAVDRPPLLVKCHGGPTAAASTTLSLGVQYWTSRGIAVLDVDYGGSTGYGRAYRDRLAGNWGVVDVADCVNAARHAAAAGLADERRLVISGGSAGGYTVLAALVFHDVFRGGASYYGVSDIAALARDTHKFESRYLDWLIGPYPARADLYEARSPLHHADRMNAPVIFFQGEEDRIVPPNQTEMMVEALRRKGIPVGYLLFSGEQHGFRRAENVRRALDAELYFYAALVFGTRLSF